MSWEHNPVSWSIKGSGFTLQNVYFINLRHSRRNRNLSKVINSWHVLPDRFVQENN